MIAGNLKMSEKTPQETAVEVLYSFSRLFLHTEYLMKIILLNLRIRNLNNFDAINTLLEGELG
jgi:hypothetical protein